MTNLDNNDLLYAILILQIIGDQTVTKTRVENAVTKADTILKYLNE